jgi:hypothetical protein
MVSSFFTFRADDHADINARGLPTDADAALASRGAIYLLVLPL